MKLVKIILSVIAVLAVLMGGVWILQGYNILPGSFMTGDVRWAYRGMGLVVVGVLLLVFTRRKKA
jgi:hypothetical protein